MPFGLCNASQTLCRLMDKVLGVDLEPKVFVYLDDIIVMSQTFEEHMILLKEVAKRLRKANLTISLEKSKFCLKEIKYLGFILDEHGLRVDPGKITGILNFATPKCIKDIRRLIGLAGWYRRFIPDFSEVTVPITNLLKKTNKRFCWSVEAQNAFTKLKSLLVSAPILVNPDFSKVFTIQTDASDTGIGAVLTQEFDEGEKVIAFMSQKLTSTQRKYPATERECLAVVLAIEKFRPYIDGVKFNVITDCASLIWLRRLKDPASRLARWSMRLQQFDFELQHRKGKHNVVPDALSRAVESIEIEPTKSLDDQEYQRVRNGVLSDPERYPNYRIENNKLYKYCHRKMGDGTEQHDWRLYVPKNLIEEVLKTYHDSPTSAHLGYAKTLYRVKANYFWPQMAKDIKRYIRECEACQINKHRNNQARVPMGKLRTASEPWEMLAIDYMGPYPRSKSGNRYLLVILDLFTKYTILEPVRQAEATSLQNILKSRVFLTYGVPAVVISDNGSQFTSKKFKEFLQSYGIDHWLNAAYHPQANPAERVNRCILAAIRTYLADDHREWDLHIPEISCALRTAVHDSSGYSPFYANFGHEMREKPMQQSVTNELVNRDHLTTNKFKMELIHDAIRKNLKDAHERYSSRYNLRTRPKQFHPDQVVLKKSFKQSKAADHYVSKLDGLYEKCKVVKVVGINCYVLTDLNGKHLGKFHANDILPFNDRASTN